MKKIILLNFAILMATISFGQIGIGIKAGVNMTSLSSDLSDYKNAAKAGYQLGAFVRLGDKLHLQPEAYFTAKTGELSFSEGDGAAAVDIKQQVTLNSVDVPVLIGYKIMDPPLFNIRLQAGPVASVVTSKKFDITVNGVETEPGDEYISNYKDINWGLQFGAGVDVLVFTIDLRYELGLSDIYKNKDAMTDDFSNMKNNVFFVSVGWKIVEF